MSYLLKSVIFLIPRTRTHLRPYPIPHCYRPCVETTPAIKFQYQSKMSRRVVLSISEIRHDSRNMCKHSVTSRYHSSLFNLVIIASNVRHRAVASISYKHDNTKSSLRLAALNWFSCIKWRHPSNHVCNLHDRKPQPKVYTNNNYFLNFDGDSKDATKSAIHLPRPCLFTSPATLPSRQSHSIAPPKTWSRYRRRSFPAPRNKSLQLHPSPQPLPAAHPVYSRH